MLKYFKNIFLIIFTIFAIWMLFFDANSLLIHNELNNDINNLEDEKDFYLKEIEKDNKELEKLSTDEGLEKFAREAYYMKRDKEEIYIIEYEDSLKNNTDD
ncbi:septum formation initiator family protein [Lacinutrix sp. C3R15]|uniref:FtsB family cell division protein n=1 Tax=Flavobacteriaceae TaxID=49546 RepID=UPI001C09E42B|nr:MULTISPECIES: septum formation initiator family protein [Flavobacteriaceae]MBU2940737.1 septum formation initiator family protein [Lacinutrix sp. C3R15]MDO6624055.1 septum formation initiator family protein [Oceanihabitans sp. 1_MG-2023]